MQSASGNTTLARAELGRKRRCLSCATAFFDLNHTPILCPKCDEVFQVVELAHSPRRWVAPIDPSPARNARKEEESAVSDVAEGDNQALILAAEEPVLDAEEEQIDEEEHDDEEDDEDDKEEIDDMF